MIFPKKEIGNSQKKIHCAQKEFQSLIMLQDKKIKKKVLNSERNLISNVQVSSNKIKILSNWHNSYIRFIRAIKRSIAALLGIKLICWGTQMSGPGHHRSEKKKIKKKNSYEAVKERNNNQSKIVSKKKIIKQFRYTTKRGFQTN